MDHESWYLVQCTSTADLGMHMHMPTVVPKNKKQPDRTSRQTQAGIGHSALRTGLGSETCKTGSGARKRSRGTIGPGP